MPRVVFLCSIRIFQNLPLFILENSSPKVTFLCFFVHIFKSYLSLFLIQDLGSQWEEYKALVEGVEMLVQEANEALPTVDLQESSSRQLVEKLNDTKVIIK